MITFDELVNLTYSRLLGKNKKGKIQVETVREILEDAGLIGLMQHGISVIQPHRITMRQIHLQGHKWITGEEATIPFEYRRRLGDGINAWIASNGSGKSTVLKAIIWALTGVKPTLKADVLLWLENVAVEIEISQDGIFTIQYMPSPQDSGVVGNIYKADIESVLNGTATELLESFSSGKAMAKAIDRFFSSHMGFFPLEMVQRKGTSINLEHKNVSWGTYSQALFVSADDYSDFLFPNHDVNGNHHQRTIGMYLGLDLLEAVSTLQAKKDEAKNNFEFEKRRVEANAHGIRQKIEQCEQELEQLDAQIIQLDSDVSVFIDPNYVENVRQRIASYDQQVIDLSNIEYGLLMDEKRIQSEIDDGKRTCQELREAIQFRLFLSGLQVERCPHCENIISTMRVEDELQSGHCRVCQSELQPITNIDQQQVLLRETEEQISKKKKALNHIKGELKKARAQLNSIQNEAQKYRAEFNDLSRQEKEGFSSELRSLLDRRGYLRGQLTQLQEQTEESQSQRLQELRNRMMTLQAAAIGLQEKISDKHTDILGNLRKLTTEMSISFGIPNLEEVILDSRFEMFVRQSGKTMRFQDMDIGEQLRLKIAFHLAMVTIRVRDGVGRHPAILIVDAPGGAEMTDEYLAAILQGFTRVEKEFGDQVQILVASTRDELLDICDPAQTEYKAEGLPVF